ncbi:hypothetical protein ADUPG1_000730, partial [Aduncisulcus paluster]
TTNTEYGDDKTIVEIFVDNLGSDRLSDRVRSEVDTAGKHKDLKYAMKQAFEELREMLLMKTEVMRHAAAFGLDIRELKPTGRKRRFSGEKQPGQPSPAGHRSQTERKPIRCFNCGKVGHKASECPFRKVNPKSQDKKSMKARVALNKESSKTPSEYMSIVNEQGEEEVVLALLDSGCEHSIMDIRIGRTLEPIEKQAQWVDIIMADGSSCGASERWLFRIKARGAMCCDLFFTEWFIMLDLGEHSEIGMYLCWECIQRLDLFGDCRFRREEPDADDWFEEPEEVDISEELTCDADELKDRIRPLLIDYMLKDKRDQPSSIEPMRLKLKDEEIRMAQPPRRLPFHRESFVRNEIESLLSKKVISPSQSEYSSPIVVVPKKGGELRISLCQ